MPFLPTGKETIRQDQQPLPTGRGLFLRRSSLGQPEPTSHGDVSGLQTGISRFPRGLFCIPLKLYTEAS